MYSPKVDFAYQQAQESLEAVLALNECSYTKNDTKVDPFNETTVTTYTVKNDDGEDLGYVTFSRGEALDDVIDVSHLDTKKLKENDPFWGQFPELLKSGLKDMFEIYEEKFDSKIEKAGSYLEKFKKDLPKEAKDNEQLLEYAAVLLTDFAFAGKTEEKVPGKEAIAYTEQFMEALPDELKSVGWLEGYVFNFFEDVVSEKYQSTFVPNEYSTGCLEESNFSPRESKGISLEDIASSPFK